MLVMLSACAGTPFKWDSVRQIKPGMTTQEVVAIAGSPYMVRAESSDRMTYIWSTANGLTGSNKSFAVKFKDGKVMQSPFVPDSFKD